MRQLRKWFKNFISGKKQNMHPDMEERFLAIASKCTNFSMTSMERMYALWTATEFIIKNNIEGDFVETGVWKGGSAMLMCKTLMDNHIDNRKIYLYDTYEGMTEPGENDFSYNNVKAKKIYYSKLNDKGKSEWCYSSIDEVKENLMQTGYPENNLVFVKGRVEDTIPGIIPGPIALLRLDTDWYESTKHELIHLFPLLVQKGVLIIDDYGHWKGCRKAVDEYFVNNQLTILLNRIDNTGRIGIKFE
jgi:hypothetical protein